MWIVDAHRDDGQRFVVRLNRRVICIGRRRTWTLGYVLHRNNSIFTKALLTVSTSNNIVTFLCGERRGLLRMRRKEGIP